MPDDRYDDRQLADMARAAAALERVMETCGYRDFLYGKWSVLTDDIRRERAARDAERAAMFVSPHAQLFGLARWNARRGWGFTDDDLNDVAREIPPAPPAGAELVARVLEVRLPDGADGTPGVLRTFRELVAVLVEEQGMRPFHLFDLWPKMRVTLRPGNRHAAGLGWRTIDLGHGWKPPDGRPPCGARGCSPHGLAACGAFPDAGLLAAAAHFPLWLKRMDGVHVPYVWLAGYELADVPHNLGFGSMRIIHHPRLTRDGRAPFLYYGWDSVPYEDAAVPIYADTKTDP